MAKKSKTILTTKLLKKLAKWTLSAHIVETLGLSSEDDAQIKKELIDLCDKGLVEKDGVRRGLKFRYIGSATEEDTEESEADPAFSSHDAGDMLAYLKQKRHDKDTLDTAGREFSDLIKYVTLSCNPGSDPSILSYSLVVKHTTDGVSLRVYNGIILEFERTFTRDKFLKFIAQSGVQFNADKPKTIQPTTSETQVKSELAQVV